MNEQDRLNTQARDFHAAFPEVREVPEAVTRAWQEGEDLTEAYLSYALVPPEREPDPLPRAVVRGVTGGGSAAEGADPFLTGFDTPW